MPSAVRNLIRPSGSKKGTSESSFSGIVVSAFNRSASGSSSISTIDVKVEDVKLYDTGAAPTKKGILDAARLGTSGAIQAATSGTLGTDNGSAFTARAFKAILVALGIAHRRGGYRDPESQAFIESWFGKLKERCVWRHEFETIDDAREVIGSYVEHYHHRPHSRLDYRTPREVAATWNDGGQTHLIPAA